jgi:hypothetical protein
MSKNFSELRVSMSPALQAKANKATKIMLAEIPFIELIKARKLFQKALAQVFQLRQWLNK